MKKLLLVLLLPLSSFAQNNEIGLSSGFAAADVTYLFHSFQMSIGSKRLQGGIAVDMADDPGYLPIVTPYAFGNIKFPVRYGYFYLGPHIGYAFHWEGMALGGQAGVTAHLGKRFALNTQLTLRMMTTDNIYHADLFETVGGEGDPLVAMTFGIRYRFH